MSKSIQQPTILKKSDSSRQQKQKSEPAQPKILTKAATKENVQVPAPVSVQQHQIRKEPEVQVEVLPMKSRQRFMYPHFNIDQKIFEYLDNENSDFLVVAAIGVKNVGKSTLMNIIADQEYVRINPDGTYEAFVDEHETFSTRKEQIYDGSTVDMFITTDRIFVLDPSPLANNVQRRDMIVAESDDLKMLIMLFQVCHLIIVVHNGYPDLSLLRLINAADSMIPSDVKHRPNFVFVGNNLQPGTKLHPIDPKIHSDCNLMIPNLHSQSNSFYHDIPQVIQDYQEQVFMLKRYSMMEDDEEIFTEKKWSQRVLQVMEAMKGDYFLRKYDGLRDKYHQPVDN